MGALAFWKAVVQDRSNFLEGVIGLLEENGIRYCVIGGVGVNAYAEPLITQYLDIAVAVEDVGRAKALMQEHFRTREFEHSYNVYDPGSKLQVQIQLHEQIPGLVARAKRREVLDLELPVAAPGDLLHLKVMAASEPRRRPSKRQKDLADISRLIEAFPELRSEVPAEIMERLFQ
jgi:hypothetical protein